jgi:hypothetical protein
MRRWGFRQRRLPHNELRRGAPACREGHQRRLLARQKQSIAAPPARRAIEHRDNRRRFGRLPTAVQSLNSDDWKPAASRDVSPAGNGSASRDNTARTA